MDEYVLTITVSIFKYLRNMTVSLSLDWYLLHINVPSIPVMAKFALLMKILELRFFYGENLIFLYNFSTASWNIFNHFKL